VELIYARWLDWGTRLSLLLLVAAFAAYAFGLLEPWVPLAALPAAWTLPVDSYLAATSSPAGWGWLRLATHGDYANLVGVALLGTVTVACYLRLLAILLARRERLYAALVLAQVTVLLAAASGVLSGAH
jgi:hypothetical protein